MPRRMFLLVVILANLDKVFSKNVSVIVVGAGAAGIAAATRLLENSITNITILEAESRIGGRIHSVKMGDTFIDLGAEFCHGKDGNVIFEMVKDLNLLHHSGLVTKETTRIYYSDGTLVNAKFTEDLVTSIYTTNPLQNIEGSVEDGFLDLYNSTILSKHNVDDKSKKIARDAIELAEKAILIEMGAFSWKKPSNINNFEFCQGDQFFAWNEKGFGMILEVLMHSYPQIKNKIKLEQKVTKIIWGSDKTVTVKTADGSSLSANHVIFTPSLGVLKVSKTTLFEPKLPRRKLKAIRALGFDAVMKIPLHFPEKWWSEADRSFFFVWSKQDLRKSLEEFPEGPRKDGVSWVSSIAALKQVTANPKVLIAWVTGPLVPKIERSREEVLKRGCMYVIRKFLAATYNVSDANRVLKSRWYTNPNFRGTYSYEKVGYFQRNVSFQDRLAESLNDGTGKPLVVFAGEATSPRHYSTVHGAIESGQRAADRIIGIYL